MRTTRLDRLLAVRASLRPGEVVTVLAPIAGELAALHGQGRVHGGVSTAAVGLDPDGRPRLLASGDADPTGSPDADVRALAALVTELVGAYPPESLTRVARDGADGLHDAAALQQALLAACRAEPVRQPRTLSADGAAGGGQETRSPARRRSTGQWLLPSGAPVPRPQKRRRPQRMARPSGRAVAAVAAVLLLASAIVAGIAATGSSRADAPSSGTSTPHATPRDEPSSARHESPSRPPTWRSTLRALDGRRSTAFARGDAGMLRGVYANASTPLATDLATLRAYSRRGLRVRGLHLELVDVRERSRSPTKAVLRVTDRLDGYRIVKAGGRLVRREPGRGEVTWRMTLRRSHHGWRIDAIRRVDG